MMRRLCDKYSRLPSDFEDLTIDQLLVLTEPESALLSERLMVLEAGELGTVELPQRDPDKPSKDPGGEGMSLTQRIRNANKPKEQVPTKPARRKRGRK